MSLALHSAYVISHYVIQIVETVIIFFSISASQTLVNESRDIYTFGLEQYLLVYYIGRYFIMCCTQRQM